MLEFKEMMTSLSNTDKNNAAHHSESSRSNEGTQSAAKEISDSESNFTIRGGESLAGELAAVYQQMLMHEQGIPYLPTTK